jgi:hypothetical protein
LTGLGSVVLAFTLWASKGAAARRLLAFSLAANPL